MIDKMPFKLRLQNTFQIRIDKYLIQMKIEKNSLQIKIGLGLNAFSLVIFVTMMKQALKSKLTHDVLPEKLLP